MKEKEIKDLINQGWIRLRMIHEVAGFPKEYVEKMMKQIHDWITGFKSVNTINIDVHEAKQIGEKTWSTFAEIEFLAKDLYSIFAVIFEATPSSIEVIDPEEIRIDMYKLNGLLNDILGKIHQLDMAVKGLSAQNIILKKKLGINEQSAP